MTHKEIEDGELHAKIEMRTESGGATSFILLFAFILGAFGCASIIEPEFIMNEPTTLTIHNLNNYVCEDVYWVDNTGRQWSFLDLYQYGVFTREISLGSSPVYFGMTLNKRYYLFKTLENVEVNAGDDIDYTIGSFTSVTNWGL